MGEPLNQSMDKPCEICGDTGCVDAILICSKCKVTRAHRYCMFKMPELDQEIWVCDECDSSQRPSFKQAQSEEPSGTKMRFMIKKPPQNSKVQYLTPEAVKGLQSGVMRNSSASPSKSYVARRPSVSRPVMSKMEAAPSSSVRPQVSIKPNPRVGPSGRKETLNNWSIPPALKCKKWSASTEKENLVSGWQDSPVHKQSSARTTQGLYTMTRKETNGPARQQCGESPTAKHVTFETLSKPVAESNNINLGHTQQSFQCLPPVSLVDDGNQVCVDTPIAKCFPLDNFSKADIYSMHTSHFVGFSPPISSGINVCAEAQPKLIDLKGKSSRATMEFDSYLPNHPAVSPTWKGVLKITSDVLPYSAINGIQAHPPCRVHSQVYKLSKQLPELLHFEMQRRQDSWLEIFEDDVPVELDIGLYFLYPLNGGSGQGYCSLLDYLDGHDLILRACIDGVELFVFSSYHLPENSRKINQKHYLWGLFRPSEVKNKAAVASDLECLARVDSVHSSESQHVRQQMSEVIDAEDMDIDMLGGLEVVGKVDIVVPKPMDNACVDQREGEKGPSDEMKVSPLSTEGSAVDFSSIKIKKECTDDMENPPSFTAPCADYEVEFEKELQRSFDKFTALMQVQDLGSLKMDIKEEVNSFF